MTMHYNTENETISSDIVKFKVSDIHGWANKVSKKVETYRLGALFTKFKKH